MAELWYGHFDSTPDDERELLAADWARFIDSFVTSGIRNGGTCLQVSENSGMSVKVDNGVANILGYIVQLTTDLDGRYYTVAVPKAHPQYPRIDRVVLRLDRRIQSRNIKPLISIGTAAQSPIAPPLTRTSDVWELSLAQLTVDANAVNIPEANIKDERFETELCGLMNSVLGLDPSAWQAEFDRFLVGMTKSGEEYKALLRKDFGAFMAAVSNDWEKWFATINADLQLYATFNFDNLAALPGVTLMPPVTDSNITAETMFITDTEIKVAEIVTDMSKMKTEKILTETETVYKNGAEVIRKTQIITDLKTGKTRTVGII